MCVTKSCHKEIFASEAWQELLPILVDLLQNLYKPCLASPQSRTFIVLMSLTTK